MNNGNLCWPPYWGQQWLVNDNSTTLTIINLIEWTRTVCSMHQMSNFSKYTQDLLKSTTICEFCHVCHREMYWVFVWSLKYKSTIFVISGPRIFIHHYISLFSLQLLMVDNSIPTPIFIRFQPLTTLRQPKFLH